ncbi:hypothetical protein ACA910_010986 [Epithemia clementina (nom. ined.)]
MWTALFTMLNTSANNTGLPAKLDNLEVCIASAATPSKHTAVPKSNPGLQPLNLPGTLGYQPGLPWLSKQRQSGLIAADAQDYVNDLRCPIIRRGMGGRVQNRQSSGISWCPRRAHKRQAQTKRPGAWAGVVCGTTPDCPYISITKEKWTRTKAEIQRLKQAATKSISGTMTGTNQAPSLTRCLSNKPGS